MNINLSRLSIALVLSIVVLITVACASSPATPALDTDTAAMQQPEPEETLQEFYSWYLAYSGERGSVEMRNPLADKAYQDSEYLTPAFVTRVDELIASFDRGGYDPFICAQDVPEYVNIESMESVSDDTVRARMRTSFEGHSFAVEMVGTDAGWKINDILCMGVEEEAAIDVVRGFYIWYLDFIGDRSSGEFRNPLVERAYRDAPNLSAGFVEQMDTLLDEQTEELGGIPADPFLCAQDIPERVEVAAISDAGSGIDVEMRSSFENHTWTVHVEPVDGNWMITDIRCAAPDEPAAATPEMTVEAFYAWYLDYIGERGSDEMRNPLVDGAYRDVPYLTDDVVADVDALLAEQREQPGGGYDPFLCAQDIPTTIDVGPAQGTADTAEVPVTTDFAGHSFIVELIRVDDAWKIRNVVCDIAEESSDSDAAAPISWQTFSDSDYDVELNYPDTWVMNDVDLTRGPPVDPVVRIVQFQPADWTEPYPPFNVEISVGTLEEYRRMYIEPTSSETLTINDMDVTLEQYESGAVTEMRYVFQHPENDDLRVTVIDWMSGFPARAEGNEAIMAVLDQVLTTVTFTQ